MLISVEDVVHDTEIDFLLHFVLFAVEDYFVEAEDFGDHGFGVVLGEVVVVGAKH